MLTPKELGEMWRDLAHTQVLSVYLDTRVTDPAMRDAWRPALLTAIRAAGAHITDPEERGRFDQAAAVLRDPSPAPGGMWSAPGWVAFATADGLRYAADLPVRPTSLCVWREGPVIAPYVRALKQHRPVIVALVESRAIRLFRYAKGAIQPIEEFTTPSEEPSGAGSAAPPRASSAPSARGAVGTEAVARHRLAAFQRMATAFAGRVDALAGEAGWVLIGGSTEWAHHAHEALGKHLDGRVLVSSTLHHDAADADMKREATDAATELRGAHGRVIVNQLLDRGNGHARAAVGATAVQRALRASAVDLLLVSPELIRADEALAENAVRAAIGQGATVEVPSGDAAAKLDGAAQGIAARLRFPVEDVGGPDEDEEAVLAAPTAQRP